MSKPLRVLQMNIGNFGIAGLSTIVYNFGMFIDSNEVIFDYFANKYTENVNDIYINNINKKKGKIFEISLLNNKIAKRIFLIYKIIYIIKKENYKIVHIHSDTAIDILKFYISAKLAGAKVIILHSHSTGVDRENNKFQITLHKMCKHFLIGKNVHYFSCSLLAEQWLYSKRVIDKKIKDSAKWLSDFYKNIL